MSKRALSKKLLGSCMGMELFVGTLPEDGGGAGTVLFVVVLEIIPLPVSWFSKRLFALRFVLFCCESAANMDCRKAVAAGS